MSVIYAEDWAAGNSLFGTVYFYNRTGASSEAQDPLYPFMWQAEGVYINGDGMLDKNPAYMGPSQDYDTAGIWIKGIGSLSGGGPGVYSGSGFWNASFGCIEAVYWPTTASLTANDSSDLCPLINLSTPAGSPGLLGVNAQLEEAYLVAYHSNDGSHDNDVQVTGAPMPVAGERYAVRLSWQCGTYDEDAGSALADGFYRLYINDVLIYEVLNISLLLEFLTTPGNLIDSAMFGFAGLLGPLESFTISDSVCASSSPLPFRSGGVERPLAWMEITRKELP